MSNDKSNQWQAGTTPAIEKLAHHSVTIAPPTALLDYRCIIEYQPLCRILWEKRTGRRGHWQDDPPNSATFLCVLCTSTMHPLFCLTYTGTRTRPALMLSAWYQIPTAKGRPRTLLSVPALDAEEAGPDWSRNTCPAPCTEAAGLVQLCIFNASLNQPR